MSTTLFAVSQTPPRGFKTRWADYQALPELTAGVLRCVAAAGYLHASVLEQFLLSLDSKDTGRLKFTASTIKKALSDLESQQLIFMHGRVVRCEAFLGERICRNWLADPQQRGWLKRLHERFVTPSRTMVELNVTLLEFRHALYTEPTSDAEEDARDQALKNAESFARRPGKSENRPLDRILLTPWDSQWFASLALYGQSMVMELLLSFLTDIAESVPGIDPLLDTLTAPGNPHRARVNGWAIRYYCLTGQFDKAEALLDQAAQPSEPTNGMRAAMLLLFKGQVKASADRFESIIARLPKAQRKRGVVFPQPFQTAYLLSLLGQEEPAVRKQFLARAGGAGNYNDNLYVHYFRFSQWVNNGVLPTSSPASEINPLSQLFLLLADCWMANKRPTKALTTALATLATQAEGGGQTWVQAQALDLLAKLDGPPSTLLQQHQWFPLATLYTPELPWQRVLSALMRVGGPTSTDEVKQSEARLVWFLEIQKGVVCGISPREQKRTAKGGWSKGRAVGLSRMQDEAETTSYLTRADREVFRHIEPLSSYYWGGPQGYRLPLEPSLPLLVGHPLVYLENADVPVDVVRGEIRLRVEETGKDIRLTLDPPLKGKQDATFWTLETPTRLAVYAVTPQILEVASLLGEGLSVPAQARAQIIDALAVLAPTLPIHSDLPFAGKNLDIIDANSQLYAHLLPSGEGLRVQMRVRPLAEGSWYPPGKGGDMVMGEHEGKTVQARRDTRQEKNALQQVEATCTILSEAEGEGGDWYLSSADTSLEFMMQLRQLGDAVTPLWPEGQRFKLAKELSEQDLALRITQKQDWFSIGGDLSVDENRVLSLKQLLALLENAPGRFIPLGDNEYVAITEQLRKRLSDLHGFADRGKQELGVPLLAAHALNELVESAGQVELDQSWRDQVTRIQNAQKKVHKVPATLQAELRDYQVDGFQWLARLAAWGVGACLADDMGLGKTVQALALLLQRAKGGAALVIAPTSLCLNWKAEAERFAPTLNIRLYHEQRHLETPGARDVVLVSYGLLQSQAETFAAQHWHTLVIDEAQAIKNAQAKRTRAVQSLSADMRVACTGTPLENHLGELWSLFRFLNPGLLGSLEQFNQRFAAPIERGDNAARKRLKRLIQPFFLRRTKTEVLAELPPRIEVTYPVELSAEEMALYEATRQRAVAAVKTASAKGKDARFQMLAEITRLRRLCCHPDLVLPDAGLASAKMEAFATLVKELLDNRHKALVFSQFVDVLSKAREVLDSSGINYQYLDGSTPQGERKKRVDAFQSGEGDVFLISLKAGGTGLNLTAADYVIHLDPWWNPAVEDQASDRAHRMGQTRPVTIYRLVAKNTIEERIVGLHAKKRELADSLLAEGDAGARVGAEELLALLQEEMA